MTVAAFHLPMHGYTSDERKAIAWRRGCVEGLSQHSRGYLIVSENSIRIIGSNESIRDATNGKGQKRARGRGYVREMVPRGAGSNHPASPFGLLRDELSRGKLVSHGSTELEWCPGAGSNHRHCDFQSHALPTELPGHTRRPQRPCERAVYREVGGPCPPAFACGFGVASPASPAASAGRARLRTPPQIIGKTRLFGVFGVRLAAGDDVLA
jgi:hypothetical protein